MKRYLDRTLIKGNVPKKIIERTAWYYEERNTDLYDSFKEACRDLAKIGTELYDAFMTDDYRKFIPSEYLEEYLDFEKYPIRY